MSEFLSNVANALAASRLAAGRYAGSRSPASHGKVVWNVLARRIPAVVRNLGIGGRFSAIGPFGPPILPYVPHSTATLARRLRRAMVERQIAKHEVERKRVVRMAFVQVPT